MPNSTRTPRSRRRNGVQPAAFLPIALFAALSRPVIPFTADRMFAIFGLDPQEAARWPSSAAEALSRFKGGEAFTPPDVLFAKIEDDQVAEWRERFGAE